MERLNSVSRGVSPFNLNGGMSLSVTGSGKMHLDLLKLHRLHGKFECFWMHWANVCRVKEKVPHHRIDTLRVDGLEDHRRSRHRLLIGKRHIAELIAGRKVLDDLCAEQSTQRPVRYRFQKREEACCTTSRPFSLHKRIDRAPIRRLER